MKRSNPIVLTLIGLLILITSCKNSKSYADRLKDEKRAIDLFIAKNNLNILKDFPADSTFAENEFYKDPNTGVYFNIMDYGPDVTKLSPRQEIYIRFKEVIYLLDNDTIAYNFNEYYPEKYVGPISTYTKNSYSIPGWIVPLSYNVGHNGRVRIIIPFEMGSSYDKSNYQTTYYDQVVYRFEGLW